MPFRASALLRSANLTFSVSQGRVEPTGIYSTCAWSTADFPYPQPTSEVAYPLPDATIAGCLDCIDATVDNTTKAYACGLCRNPGEPSWRQV
eukprot:344106-Chlamydomonas_euryale.AAC.1